MKKKLFVFVVLAMVLVACNPAVKGGETPLELTAANLAGRWVLESNNNVWVEFDVSMNCKNPVEVGTYSIVDSKTIQATWKDVLNIVTVIKHNIAIYKNYIVLNNDKYVKSN